MFYTICIILLSMICFKHGVNNYKRFKMFNKKSLLLVVLLFNLVSPIKALTQNKAIFYSAAATAAGAILGNYVSRNASYFVRLPLVGVGLVMGANLGHSFFYKRTPSYRMFYATKFIYDLDKLVTSVNQFSREQVLSLFNSIEQCSRSLQLAKQDAEYTLACEIVEMEQKLVFLRKILDIKLLNACN